MGASGTYYNVDDYVSWKRKQGTNFRSPPRANFLAAANHIRTLFDAKKFNWAAMGGLAMLCLGSRREMPDIHIIYEDRDFSRMKSKLESDPRAKLPQTMNPLFPSKILLSTGPMYKDAGCVDNVEVEIDLIPPGSHGSPPNDVLRKNQVLLRLNLDGRMSNFKGLNMLYLVKTSLHYCKSQDLKWDPKVDILFMCQNYGKELEAIRSKLDAQELERIFFSTLFYSRLSVENQRSCSFALLGKELLRSPPPTMAVTPPPNAGFQPPALPGQSARPSLHTSKSTPQLQKNQQTSADYLTPPLPGKVRTSPRPSPSSAQTQPPPASGTQVEMALNNTVPRDSRSRYRSASAQQTPGHGRSVSADTHNAPKAPFQQSSVAYRGSSQPPSSSMPSQAMAYGSRPQGTPSGRALTPFKTGTLGPMPQNSLPNLRSSLATTGPVPVYSHPTSRAGAMGPAAAANNAHLPAYGYTAATILPSQRKHIRASSNDAVQPNTSTQEYRAPSSSTFGSREQHVSNQTATENTQAAGLRIVGPQGLYPTPSKPAQPSVPSNTTGPDHQQQFTANLGPISPPTALEQRNFAVELPANAYSDVSPLQSPETNARVSPAIVAAQPQHPNISQFSLPNSSGTTQSPRQPPMMAELPAGPAALPTHHSRPTHPRTHSEPITSLPTILMAGRPSSHRHSPKNSITNPSPSPPVQQPQQAHTPQIRTNANRYTQYHHTNQPYSTPAPPDAISSVYKAYTGPVSASTPILPSTINAQQPQHTDSVYHEQPMYTNYHHHHYQGQEGNGIMGLQQQQQHHQQSSIPQRAITGYEDFTHGPYTPVVSNEEVRSSGRFYT